MPGPASSVIEDVSAVATTVVQPLGAPTVPVRARADLTREYVAVGGYGYTWPAIRQLPLYIDSVTRDLRLDQYREMRQDPHIESPLTLRIGAILDSGYRVVPSHSKDDTEYAQSLEIAQFVTWVLDNLETPFLQTLAELCLALAYGYKVAELVYDYVDRDGTIYLVPRAIKCRPQESVGFAVDAYNNIVGLVARGPGGALPSLDLLRGDTGGPVLLPRRKFLILSHRPENGDPRGTSVLRPAYHAYWFTAQVYQAYLHFLARFGSPSVIIYADPDSEPPMIKNPLTGEETPDPRTAEAIAADEAAKIQNGASAGLPAGARAELLEATNSGDPFMNALHLGNTEKVEVILGQSLMTQEGKHQARAASETHQDVFGIFNRFDKLELSGAVRGDLFRPIVEYNYGIAAARKYCPRLYLGEGERHDFATNAAAIFRGFDVGYFDVRDVNQLLALDNFLNLPDRDPAIWKRIGQRLESILDNPATAVGADRATLTARLVAKDQAMHDAKSTAGP